MNSLKHAIVGALAAATAATGAMAGAVEPAPQLTSAVYTADAAPQLQEAAWVWGGRNYCWYGGGWHGPGWYWCGYAGRRGYGWGGPVGWHGWRGGHPGWRGGWHRGWHRGWRGGRGHWRR